LYAPLISLSHPPSSLTARLPLAVCP